jgi:hypothetical protein
MRRQGVEDIKGKMPLALGRPAKPGQVPRRDVNPRPHRQIMSLCRAAPGFESTLHATNSRVAVARRMPISSDGAVGGFRWYGRRRKRTS